MSKPTARLLYGVSADGSIGVGEVIECEAYRVTEDGWFMKVDGSWYASFGIFYINDDKKPIYLDDEEEEYPGYERERDRIIYK
jgi:hypothetical protein